MVVLAVVSLAVVGSTRSISSSATRRRDGKAQAQAGLDNREESVSIDPSRFMTSRVSEAETPYSTGHAPHQAPLSPTRLSDGGMAPVNNQSYERHDLLPKDTMSKLKQVMGDRVHNLTRDELFSIARERGLLGTEESAPAAEAPIGEDHTTTALRLAALSLEKNQPQDEDAQSIEAEIKRHITPRASSESDKILGIQAGDPRAEEWPKLSDEMRSLLNLENHGVFRADRRITLPEAPKPITEATGAGAVGAFIGAGMGGGLAIRGKTCPSYDASYNLPDDPDERVQALKKMLDKHGIKGPLDVKDDKKSVKEDTATQAPVQPPVMRDPGYDSHPSRFMK
jgi:hypothetical protein